MAWNGYWFVLRSGEEGETSGSCEHCCSKCVPEVDMWV